MVYVGVAEYTAVGVHSGPRLDRLPISAFHWRMLALIGAGMFLDGFEIYLAGGVVSLLIKTGWTDLAGSAQFISAGVFGMMIGAWFAGVLGDRFGRKVSYQVNLLIFGLASFAAAAAPSMPFLIAARFVMGIGLGAEIVVGFGTLMEFIPSAHRGRWGAGLSMCENGALFVAAIAGYFILPAIGWRWLFVAVGIAALAVWALRKNMPESPRWLESKGRLAEAELIVAAIEQEVGVSAYVRPDTPSLPVSVSPLSTSLFSRTMLSRLLVGLMVNIGGNAAVYGFIAWVPTFFVKQGLTVTSSLGFTALISLGGPAGAAIGMVIADRLDRKWTTVALSLMAAALGALYPFVSSNVAVSLVGFALVTVIYVFVSVAWAAYIPELFPTQIRLRGAGFCNAGGRLVTTMIPFAVVPLFNSYGVAGVAGLLCGVLIVQALVVAIFGIRTNSQSLEALAPSKATQ